MNQPEEEQEDPKTSNPVSSEPPTRPVEKGAAKSRPKKRGLKIWVFRLMAILIPLVATELGARAYFFLFVHDNIPDEFQSDSEIPYRFPANSNFLCADTPTTTNNLQLRETENIDVRVPYQGTRIICLGDSVTFGYCASGNEKTYPALLEKILRSRGYKVQVINGGMPRYRAQHVSVFYSQHLEPLRADVVIQLGGWNNANDQILLRDKNAMVELVHRHWYTFRMVRHWGLFKSLGGGRHHPATLSPEGISKYRSALKEIRHLAKRFRATPLFCTLPHFFDRLDSDEARQKALLFPPGGTPEQIAEAVGEMNDQIREVALAEWPAIELTDVNEHRYFGDAIHPNDLGCQKIAEQVADYLIQKDLVGKN